MNHEKWPFFEDWEEIFGRDRATGEFAEGPQDAVEEIENSGSHGLSNDMSLGIYIPIDNDEEVAGHGPDVASGGEENVHGGAENVHGQGAFTGASRRTSDGTQQSQQQGKNTKISSSNVNDKEKNKKRKRSVGDDDETSLKSLVDVMKQIAANHDKNMGALIENLGERDQSEICGRVLDILASPFFELYTSQQQIKAAMGLTADVKRMELFLRMGELQRQTMAWMIVNDEFPSI